MMPGNNDSRDKREARLLALILVVLIVALVVAAFLLFPQVVEIANTSLSPGLGLKDAAVLSFFITIVLMIVFAFASGDGLLGELQFVLVAFFVFFMIIWLMLAWIF